ncbi:MAG: hypothetical protein U0930_11610 [Pirellulales bacterium]
MAFHNDECGCHRAVLWILFNHLFRGYREPNLYSEVGSSKSYDFRLRSENPGKRDRIIIIAGSGGGTRAALFTQSGIAGLQRLGVLQDAKLVSGVSGGGVALGYFASHREKLIGANPDVGGPWKEFSDAMSHDYIIDVLRGASEFRISKQSFIGTLLAESLERQFFARSTAALSTTQTGATKESGRSESPEELPIGVIFNSTLVGAALGTPSKGEDDDAVWHRLSNPALASSADVGSRVVYTNLNQASTFFPKPKYPLGPGDYFNFEVVPIFPKQLTKALALNANFPPVFPNAPVDVKTGNTTYQRLWVTDGGALENKGVIALLYTLLKTVERERQSLSDPNEQKDAIMLPDVSIVVFDASAGSVRYKHDQGLSAALGAPTRLANQLALELQNQLIANYASLHNELPAEIRGSNPPKIELYEIPMPSCLRIDGGIGTHWMLPDTVTVSNSEAKPGEPKNVLLSGKTVRALIEDLHRDEGQQLTFPKSSKFAAEYKSIEKDLSAVWSWIMQDPIFEKRGHQDRWNALRASLATPVSN